MWRSSLEVRIPAHSRRTWITWLYHIQPDNPGKKADCWNMPNMPIFLQVSAAKEYMIVGHEGSPNNSSPQTSCRRGKRQTPKLRPRSWLGMGMHSQSRDKNGSIDYRKPPRMNHISHPPIGYVASSKLAMHSMKFVKALSYEMSNLRKNAGL